MKKRCATPMMSCEKNEALIDHAVSSYFVAYNSVFSRTIRHIFFRHNSNRSTTYSAEESTIFSTLPKKWQPFPFDKTRTSGLFPGFSRYRPFLKNTLYQPFSFFCKPYPTNLLLVLLSMGGAGRIGSSPCKHSSHREGYSGVEFSWDAIRAQPSGFRGRTTAPTGCGDVAGIKKPGQLVAARAWWWRG